jgi:pantoate--beta-alanine ligase
VLCGASRPGHFDGVTTVVTKLFSMVGACRAYFGRKDAQQLAVVRRMTRDLDLPVEVVGCPLVREIDGLAMSSRNAYLTDDDREGALVLCRSLFVLSEAVQRGERDCARLRALLDDMLGREPRITVDYAAIVDAATLEPVERLDRSDSSETLVALAAFVGRARLIDNVTISVSGEHATVDLGRTAVPAAEER